MEKKDRNEEIYRKRMEGRTLRSLADEYGVSIERIRQITLRDDYEQSDKLRERFIKEFHPLVATKQQSSMSINGMFNSLLRACPRDIYFSGPEAFLNWFMDCTVVDFIDFRNLGPARISVLVKIQNTIRETKGFKKKLLNGCKVIT